MSKLQDCMLNHFPNGCLVDECIDVSLMYNRAMVAMARLMPSHLGDSFHPLRDTGHPSIRHK